jgi:hypothetical protein
MKPYNKAIKSIDHDLETVMSAYEASGEVEFVQKFFGVEEINTILEECGLSTVDSPKVQLEHPVHIGSNTKRADLTFEDEDQLFYFEVMSKSRQGKWDNDHHEQIMTKTFKFGLEYGAENVHTFAVAFKEFDAMYLNDIQKMENGYAVHLRFTDQGYFADVYGIEEKKKKVSVKLASMEEVGQRWLDLASEKMGFENRKEVPQRSRWLYVGKAYSGRRIGIEWVMNQKMDTLGIKIHGEIVKDHGLTKYIDNTQQIIDAISEKVEGFDFVKFSNGESDRTITFKFDAQDFSDENVNLLKDITVAFAEELEIEKLLS